MSRITATGLSREELIAMAREADPFGDDGRLVSLAMLTPGTLERFAAQMRVTPLARAAENLPPGWVAVPVEVKNLFDFMSTVFVPMTAQQEEIAVSLRLAKDALAAAAPKPPECAADDGWQPIETAPRDAWLWLWRAPLSDFGRLDPLVIAKWDAEQQTWVWPDGPYDVFTERGLRLAEEDLDNCDYYNADEFTHWRPLPKPPTDKGAPDA